MKTRLIFALLTALGLGNAITHAQDLPAKVHHTEPLFLDLVRDLGARKGEKEINIGMDYMRNTSYNEQLYLVEYEFAPIHRLGLEIEADYVTYNQAQTGTTAPANRLEALRLSSQYSFYVNPEMQMTMAVGYTQIFECTPFADWNTSQVLEGTVYNPFFIAAKRWGANWHTLAYLSPMLRDNWLENQQQFIGQINTSVHYQFPNTSHFVGVEMNQEISKNAYEFMLRPQAKYKVNQDLAVGVVYGIPLKSDELKSSAFIRLIYEL